MQKVEKHIDIFTNEELQKLIREQNAPCISLYMPIEQQAVQTRQNPIRFKNLMTEIEKHLSAAGFDQQQIDRLLSPIGEDRSLDFSGAMSDGLALFVTPGLYRSYRVPHMFQEFVFVGDHFHIRRILPLVTEEEQFYVLALNQEQVKLFRGSRYQLGEVDLGDVPQSLSDALKYDEFERHVQFHSTDNAPRQNSDAQFHGQGTAANDSIQKEQILRLFQTLDNAITEHLNAEGFPLILAGTDELRGLYHQANHYNKLLDDDIQVNPQALDETDIHQQAWSIVQRLSKTVTTNAIEKFQELAGTGDERASNQLEHIVPSAYYQRVDTLFLPSKGESWGVFLPESGAVAFHEHYQKADQDLLNVAAIYTLQNGGTVHTLPIEQIPGDHHAAAILRY